jgi:hypothetical protein
MEEVKEGRGINDHRVDDKKGWERNVGCKVRSKTSKRKEESIVSLLSLVYPNFL